MVRTSCQEKCFLLIYCTLAVAVSPGGGTLHSIHLTSSDTGSSEAYHEANHVSYMSHLTHLHFNLFNYCIFCLLTLFWMLNSDIEILLFLSKESASTKRETQKYRYDWYKTQSFFSFTCNGKWGPSQSKFGSWRSGVGAEENGITKTGSVQNTWQPFQVSFERTGESRKMFLWRMFQLQERKAWEVMKVWNDTLYIMTPAFCC